MRLDAVDERGITSRRATLNIEVDPRRDARVRTRLCHAIVHVHAPIQDSVSERTRRAAAAEEQVPDGICERLRLAIRRKADRPCGTSEAEGHNFPLRLARLDIRPYRRTDREIRARKSGVVGRVADLQTSSKRVRAVKTEIVTPGCPHWLG